MHNSRAITLRMVNRSSFFSSLLFSDETGHNKLRHQEIHGYLHNSCEFSQCQGSVRSIFYLLLNFFFSYVPIYIYIIYIVQPDNIP